ncbi:hypothetical protein MWR44_26490, partial [Klebsiella pneumoniae]|nr:hypothetical protein [Klebsiella pneumoniae]
PGMAQAESISFFTGLTMRWFRDAFCAEEKLIAERLGVFARACSSAARVPAILSRVPFMPVVATIPLATNALACG